MCETGANLSIGNVREFSSVVKEDIHEDGLDPGIPEERLFGEGPNGILFDGRPQAPILEVLVPKTLQRGSKRQGVTEKCRKKKSEREKKRNFHMVILREGILDSRVEIVEATLGRVTAASLPEFLEGESPSGGIFPPASRRRSVEDSEEDAPRDASKPALLQSSFLGLLPERVERLPAPKQALPFPPGSKRRIHSFSREQRKFRDEKRNSRIRIVRIGRDPHFSHNLSYRRHGDCN